MKLDCDLVVSNFLYVLAQTDPSALDWNAAVLERLGYIKRGNRSEQDSVLAHSPVESKLDSLHLLGFALRREMFALFAFRKNAPLFFEHFLIACAGLYRQTLRQ